MLTRIVVSLCDPILAINQRCLFSNLAQNSRQAFNSDGLSALRIH